MPPTENFPGGPLHQSVIEWRVEGAIDGVTPAPGLRSRGNIVVQAPTPPEYPFIIDVDGDAGLFDPDADGGRAAFADRYIEWVRVVPATFPVPPAFILAVGDASGEVPSVGAFLPIAAPFSGAFLAPGLYFEPMALVPQGFVVQVAGLPPPPPGLFHTVTIGVRAAMVTYEDARFEQNSCCAFDPG